MNEPSLRGKSNPTEVLSISDTIAIFTSASIELNLSNKNIFFGLNDVGKTNFLYALRYVSDKDIRKLNLTDSDFHNKQIDKPIEIIVMLDISNVENSDCQKLRAQLKGALQSKPLTTDNKKNFIFELAQKIVENSTACRLYLQAKYFKIYIDEYQDCDKSMHKLFMYLCDTLKIETFVAGDEKQSIYIWRGAYPEAFVSRYRTIQTYYMMRHGICTLRQMI